MPRQGPLCPSATKYHSFLTGWGTKVGTMFSPPSTLRDSQGRGLKFIFHLLFREFLTRKTASAFNRDGIIFKRQFERPSTVVVSSVLHVAGYGPVANVHGVDITRITWVSNFLEPSLVGSDSGNGCWCDGSAVGSVGPNGPTAKDNGTESNKPSLRMAHGRCACRPFYVSCTGGNKCFSL